MPRPSTPDPRPSRRGGRRPAAGAPRGNLNSLKPALSLPKEPALSLSKEPALSLSKGQSTNRALFDTDQLRLLIDRAKSNQAIKRTASQAP